MENSKTDTGHVHFPQDQLDLHESQIVIQQDSETQQSVHLGFLQFHYHYEIRFTIKDKLGEDVKTDPLENLHAKFIEVMPSEDGEGHDVVVDFAAHKEKLVKEELSLTSESDPSKSIKLVLHARVLGKGKGTPSLRQGIHCVGIDADEDSEQSDWQGFD